MKKSVAYTLERVLRRFARKGATGQLSAVSDGHLLGRFETGSDESAFTALVERHGAMVFGVCFRILLNPHDAEDACQATFLVLARKASAIRKRSSIASWLHGVARRVSLALVRERVARQRHEREVFSIELKSTVAADMLFSEFLVLLDEELERLPENLRGPIVLCYLQGKTRDEAAAVLGLTLGKLHGLLQRGRARLHDRLVKRGVSLGAGFLTVGLSGGVGQALPPNLVVRIINAANALRGGRELVPVLASSQAENITNEVLRAMLNHKLKAASLWGAICACVLIGGGVLMPGFARQEDKPVRRSVVSSTPKDDQKAANIEFRKTKTIPTENANDFRHAVLVVSNEQKAVLSRNLIVTDRDDPKATTSGLHVWTFDGDKPKRTRLGDSTTIGFVPKSSLGYSVIWGSGVVFWDTRTQTKVGEPIPHVLREDTMPLPAFGPDGKVMVTRSKLDELQFWELKTRKPIGPAIKNRGIVWKIDFSPDGKWAYSESSPGELSLFDAETGKPVAGPFRNDVIGRNQISSPNSHQIVTFEMTRNKAEAWKSEVVIRSTANWEVVHRVGVTGPVREGKWIDDSHLLLVGEDKTKLDNQGRPAAAGRNLLHVVNLGGPKPETQTIVNDAAWIRSIDVAPDGKHFVSSSYRDTTCWKLGVPKPLWTKPGGFTAHFGNGDWIVLSNTNKREAAVFSLVDGEELWRQDNVEDVRVQGSDLWVFGQKKVEIWRAGEKTKG